MKVDGNYFKTDEKANFRRLCANFRQSLADENFYVSCSESNNVDAIIIILSLSWIQRTLLTIAKRKKQM
jgi:hypothetical protein